MALILTFLGKGGTGRSTIAVAAAKQLAGQGKRVLFATQDPTPAIDLLLETPLTADPQPVAGSFQGNFQAMKLYSTTLLERSWEEVKKLEAQYLRSPFFKAVYGQELGVLPGMDNALALNAVREYEKSGSYDVIVYDGTGDLAMLRVLGMPETLSWYIRRFRQVFADSDLGKTISPFVQPIAGAVLNVNWTSGDIFNQPAAAQVNNLLEEGRNAVADPNRVIAYLVTNDDPGAVATAQYLWGSAQQVGLTVGGVLLNQAQSGESVETTFAPLTVRSIPNREGDWQSVMSALPDFTQATNAPRPIRIDTAERKVYLFLPGFDKKQVKLTQYGPEVTIEAGDQRRNIFLPPQLSGKPVSGAKFQDGYLIISF
ncbi:Get3/ArsA fold putative tail anchor-mediating ATPase NosAFP [Leptolyngbya ohadii]|uniref:Get3/ArsA fold putative tail anchor-mediating ATPase NosAFP n=1 Tax=Leptolyngbya ohadii TaxID=1962290 RepID=UPI000B5A1D0D|nr:ArsA family ATPase [Leptolyngbya ohadii]